MFGIGGPELFFIFILALLIFGPKKLPQIGRTLGKGMAEFRRASTELQRAINTEIEEPPATRPAAAPAAGGRELAPVAAASGPAAAPTAEGAAAEPEGTAPSQFQ
jgi:TatA/E family protein of Tat protein translocase